MKNFKNVNPTKLADELIEKNINISLIQNDLKENEYVANNIWITFADGTDMDLVQQIIDNHDPTPLSQPPTDKERLQALEQALLEIVLGGM